MKLNTIFFQLVILILIKSGSLQRPTTTADLTLCEEIETRTEHVTAFIGWPHKIFCNLPASADYYTFLYDDLGDLPGDLEIKCSISNKGKVLYNTTMTKDELEFEDDRGLSLPDLQQDSQTQYQVVLQVPEAKFCYFANVHLNLTQYQHVTCEEFVKSRVTRQNYASDVNDRKEFTCALNSFEYPKIHVSHKNENTTVDWLRNCSKLLPGQVEVSSNKRLHIASVNFEHAGIYVCSVTHNGMTRYVNTFKVCVSHPPTSNKPIISCQQRRYYVSLGGNVTANCTINMGEGTFDLNYLGISWKKTNNSVSRCFNMHSPYFKIVHRPRTSCSISAPEKNCFLHVANEKEKQITPYLVQAQITIRNITLSDLSEYKIFVTSHHGVAEQSIELSLQKDSDSQSTSKFNYTAELVVILLLSFIIFIALLVTFLRCRKKYLTF